MSKRPAHGLERLIRVAEAYASANFYLGMAFGSVDTVGRFYHRLNRSSKLYRALLSERRWVEKRSAS